MLLLLVSRSFRGTLSAIVPNHRQANGRPNSRYERAIEFSDTTRSLTMRTVCCPGGACRSFGLEFAEGDLGVLGVGGNERGDINLDALGVEN